MLAHRISQTSQLFRTFKFSLLPVLVAALAAVLSQPASAQCNSADSKHVTYATHFGTLVPLHDVAGLRDPLSTSGTLKVISVGDSVMWGNGEKLEHKMVYLVGQSVADATRKNVAIISYAHSGARLKVIDDPGSWLPVHDGVPLQDLDAQQPTTEQQLDCAAVSDSDADLILLDGCINEVHATDIAVPPLFNNTSTSEIDKRVFNNCAENMQKVLNKAVTNFPHATVVVLNYYRIVSDVSKWYGLFPLEASQTPAQKAHAKAVKKEYTDIEKTVEKVLKKQGGSSLAPQNVQKRAQQWADNAAAFLSHSQRCINWAAACANGTSGAISCKLENANTDAHTKDNYPACPDLPAQFPGPVTANSPRVFVATVPDNPDYSYGAPQKHLWSYPVPFLFFWSLRADEVYSERAHLCRYALSSWEKCKSNVVAHPNRQGAETYRESIMNVLAKAWKPTLVTEVAKPDAAKR